ncbi:MAG: aminotransferase class I/II-fold pyridoxal phosphate-dependent enzyme [Acidimicrobiia bacterium]
MTARPELWTEAHPDGFPAPDGGRVLPAGPHGGDAAAVAAALGRDPDDVLDLSVSLNPEAPDVAALAVTRLGALRRYPDVREATAAMAAALGTAPERVLLTNGGSEAIALVCGDLGRAAVATPGEFSLYSRHLAEVVHPADAPTAPRVRSNPHNPTGRLAGTGEQAAVWDEAFYPLAAGAWTRSDPEAVVVGSLTKVFACPGLRAGYVWAPDPGLIERLAARQPRWALNALAAALIPELLVRADLPAWQRITAERRVALTRAIPGALRSDANYVLVEVAGGAPAARERLAHQGVLVRDCTSFGLPGHIRVAVPDEAGLRRLVSAWEKAGL